MSVTRRGLAPLPEYESLAVKAGILENATYPAQTIKNALTGEEYDDPRAGMHVATIAAALEYGVNQHHPRPFMQNTVARQRKVWADGIVKLVKGGMPARTAIETIGQVMKEDIQETVRDWPADNDEGWAAIKGFNHGLEHTFVLLNSIESAVIDKDES